MIINFTPLLEFMCIIDFNLIVQQGSSVTAHGADCAYVVVCTTLISVLLTCCCRDNIEAKQSLFLHS
jgi:hypothetical protein